MQHADAQLKFHHNFTQPVRLADTDLFYDPARVDQFLTRIQTEREDRNANSRNTSAARC
jgi:hypothetical protein